MKQTGGPPGLLLRDSLGKLAIGGQTGTAGAVGGLGSPRYLTYDRIGRDHR